jgi:hypothetical protein
VTTVPAYERYPEIVTRLERARGALRAVATGRGVLAFVALAAGSLLAVTLLAGFVPVPGWVRAVLLLATGLTWMFALVRFALKPLFWDTTAEAMARRIEQAMPDLENGLINAVQLAHDRQVPSPPLVNRVIGEIAGSLEGRDLTRAVERRSLQHLAVVALVVLALLGGYAVGWPHRFRGALSRLWNYNAYVPFVGGVRIREVQPKDCAVVVGQPVTVRVKIDNPEGRLYPATLFIRPEGTAAEEPLTMGADAPDSFLYTVSDVRTPFAYRARIGDSETARYHVAVNAKPVVSGIEVLYHYPPYTGLPDRHDAVPDITAVRYSYVDLNVHVNKPVTAGALLMDGDRVRPLDVGGDGRRLSARLTVERSGTYRVRVTDADGFTNEDAQTHQITALDDRPPVIHVRLPGKDVEVAPGDRLTVVLQAQDDFGVSEVKLWTKAGGVGEPRLVRRWTGFDRARDVPITFEWPFPASQYKKGDALLYYAEAVDTRNVQYGADRLTPQTSASASYLVKFLDREEAVQERVNALEKIRKALLEILALQQQGRTEADRLAAEKSATNLAAGGRNVERLQVDVRSRTTVLANDCQAEDRDQTRIRAVLTGLANNEMADAVKSAGETAKVTDLAQAGAPLDALLKAQDRIIAALQKLLNLVPELKEKALAEAASPAGHDLPPDAAAKFRDLLDKLNQFAEQQKKVIDATQELAKVPVDNFSDEEKNKLKALEAAEDEWAKFMKEAHTELSKLPPQDFADPNLLKELVEIQSDVEMAKDALAKKAVELAVPLEQAGLEKAEELTTHLERWLPDTPDRDQWKMEEPLAGSDQEQAPMSQLPKELQDMVGDLMEQEEDLFEDLEDVTSQWADSLDKGAGWDAMDGPISNMSAQGVTGNRLPNSSEIAGRSGEGREGKAAGEFVEEEATGKGGRRTPTRLTPDAFQEGEVKDSSKTPPGGSTGGGKLSGAAGQGLEGPVPPQLSRDMQRLQGRQAELRNQAERINLQFKVLNYGSSKLEEVAREMKGVEGDLANLRYGSALRRREVLLKDLKTARMLLTGEIAIHRDQSVNLPDRLQGEIRDAMHGEIPEGYQDLIATYYRALAKGAQGETGQ